MSFSQTIFVFLEILDPPAVSLLSSLRTIFKGRDSSSSIHVTVRGPYKKSPKPEKLEQIWSSIQGEGLLINGIGKFEFPDRHVVYIRSNSPSIRKIWWKRDFPIVNFGFNPHITLFEGAPLAAAKIEKFLRQERIELFCRQLSLSLYTRTVEDLTTKSVSRSLLYESPPISTTVLQDPYRWRSGIDDRARDLMHSIRSANK